MEKQVTIGILAIVLISFVAVMFNDGSITGLNAYGYSSKIYGPGLKNAYHNPTVFGKTFDKALNMQRNQQYMLAHKDEWNCSFDTSDGPFPCMQDENTKKWCCLFPKGATSNVLAPPPVPGAKYPQYIKYSSGVRPETKLTGIMKN